jgi:hypothetical protein
MSKVINNFAGLNGFVWWVGEVRDINDPLKMGRVRIRIFGWHTSNPNDMSATIPDNELPWAHPVLPINNTGSGTNLRQSDWVVGFFMDGESGQFPIVFGYVPGYAGTGHY